MARLLIYKKEDKTLVKAFIAKGPVMDELIKETSDLLGTEVTDFSSFYQALSKLGYGCLYDLHFEPEDIDNLELGYGHEYEYEVNIEPFSEFDLRKIRRLQFSTATFDSEEVESILELPEIRDIYGKDEAFRKLIGQIQLVGANWDVLVSYLVNTYGFKFTFIYYRDEEESMYL